MTQLVQLNNIYDEFEKRDTMVIAISQEDTSLEEAGKFLRLFRPDGPKFNILADVNRENTLQYDRTTAYLIDKTGTVRQVFPMVIHARPSWLPFLGEIEKLKN